VSGWPIAVRYCLYKRQHTNLSIAILRYFLLDEINLPCEAFSRYLLFSSGGFYQHVCINLYFFQYREENDIWMRCVELTVEMRVKFLASVCCSSH